MNLEENKTQKKSYHLKNLYLDPNNYRFIDNEAYKKVPEESVFDERVQKRTRVFIEGKNRENIKDLIDSFKSNGFLEVDVIQVSDLGQNRYMVLEGNRRVAALKSLQEDFENGNDIGELDSNVFKSIPFEIHDNNNKQKHLIVMGLKHISGNKKWSPLNQAQLIYDYLSPFWGNDSYYEEEEKLCKSLGITKISLRVSQRAYHLILAYKKSDYGDQFKSDMYSIFVEIIKRPTIKEWIEWNDESYKADNNINLLRLFSWFSKHEEVDKDNEDSESEPIITKAIEMRELSSFINNEEAIKILEGTRSLTQALINSGAHEKQNFEIALRNFKENLSSLKRYKDYLEPSEISEISNGIDILLPTKKLLEIGKGNLSVCFEEATINHFSNITIKKYKNFKEFSISKLNRINIIAGCNNSGKTSLIEAIYLLARQNDMYSFFELMKFKNKFRELNYYWLNQIFNEEIIVEGVFSEKNTSIKVVKFEEININKKDDYITSYKIISKIDDRELTDTIHTFGYNNIERKNEKIKHLCKSIIKSPYYFNYDEILETYSEAVERKINGVSCFDKVLEYMRKVDKSINNIRLISENDVSRFIIDSDRDANINLDITHYGEGIQRLFEIALSFAYAKNGIICIDEFETSFHHSLLKSFTKFIQQLSEDFNVQVFLTTHSKECIDAFVNNDYRNDNISAFLLENKANEILLKCIQGERLAALIDSIDLDIRGGNVE